MTPKFIQLPEKKIVGLGTKFISILSTDKTNATLLPALWQKFMKDIGQIGHREGEEAYGIVEMLGKSEAKSHPGEMYYIAAVEVSDFDGMPKGMVQRTIPAGRYASFTHKGSLTGLEKTMREIFTSWLPQSKLKLRNAPQLEVYDRRFNHESDQSEFDILLPIE